MSLTANGKANLTTSPKTSISSEPIIIRRATLKDAPEMGRVGGRVYYDTPLTSWLWPHRAKYHAQYERHWIERRLALMLNPRNESYVACSSSGQIVGAAQFARLGDDAGAWKRIREIGVLRRVFMWVAAWVFWGYCKVRWWLEGGDKTQSKEAVETFASWCRVDGERYWESHEEMASRWHCQSLVVLPEWQGKGIGKKLMAVVMEKAQRDGVIIGLEASAKGEGLYTKLGFELLGRFTGEAGAVEDVGQGGMMIWYPEGYKKEASSEM